MKSYNIVLALLLLLILVFPRAPPKFSSNYNPSVVNDFATVLAPLQVPLSLPRYSEHLSSTPINEKYNILRYRPSQPNLQVEGLESKMVHIDFEMIYEEQAPVSMFEQKHTDDYFLLENREFQLIMTNPSEIFTICINQIFSDCESIKKATRRNLPICLNSWTKYPLHFNLYMTSFKSREAIKAGIIFNVTLKYEQHIIINRVWLRQVNFILLPNHLKLYPFQLKNCRQQNNIINIKNPQKHDLSFILIYKYKKYYLNGQPLDDKFTINSQKTFKFMIQGRDSTMTVYTQPTRGSSSDRSYPVLYVPVYCIDSLTIQNFPIGIISASNLALIYPIVVTSHSNSLITIEQISAISTSQAVELITKNTYKSIVQSNQKHVQVGQFIVWSTNSPRLKNSLTIRIRYSFASNQNSSQWSQTVKILTYSEMQDPIEVGSNRFYEIDNLRQSDYNQTQKIFHFNYTVINKLQIPIRIERILFNSKNFRMHWFRYNALYIYPDRQKQQFLLQYIGPKQLPVSPAKYITAIEFSGGIFVPFLTLVYDNTLSCKYQDKQQKCNTIKYINFGQHKTQLKIQTKIITFSNLNPQLITLSFDNFDVNTTSLGVQFSTSFGEPFPKYDSYMYDDGERTHIKLRSGHIINFTVEMRIVGNPMSGEVPLFIQTIHEQIRPKIRFNFEEGKLLFLPDIYMIKHFDQVHRGQLQFYSTFQDIYQIKQIISDNSIIQFYFNESQQYEQNTKVNLTFLFNPHKDENNVTQQCCGEDFLKVYYLSSLINLDQNIAKSHQITLLTNTDIEKKMKIKVGIQREALISVRKGRQQIDLKVLKTGANTHLKIMVNNPYQNTMKYNVFLIPQKITYKPRDFVNYFKYARKERIQAYFCFKTQGKNQNLISSTSIKQLFHLDDKPIQMPISRNSMGNIDFSTLQKQNLSSHEYLASVVTTGQQQCYKLNTLLYFKLLIESQIINDLLDGYSYEIVQKFMEKQYEHITQASIALTYDHYYTQIKLNLREHCNSAFFPIFKFCLHSSIQLLPPIEPTIAVKKAKKHGRIGYSGYLLQSMTEQPIELALNQVVENQLDFQLVIANNYSKFDDYRVHVELVQPEIFIGEIAFQQNHKIKNQVFLKHYFPALAHLNNQQMHYHSLSRSNIIPLYLTNQDFDQQFSIFKGHRFFDIVNQAAIDIDFTHFGFEDRENITQFSGLSIQMIESEVNDSQIILKAARKNTFKVSFNLDSSYTFNLTNQIYHHRVNLYLYKQSEYHIQLQLLIKVADNVLNKLKLSSSDQLNQDESQWGYILINFISLGFIISVIKLLKKEEQNKDQKIKQALQKQKKILNKPKVQEIKQLDQENGVEDKIRRRSHLLPPEAIGDKIIGKQQFKYKPISVVSQDELAFFKSLKVREDKSIVSQSSEGDQFILRMSHDEEHPRTEQEKSIQRYPQEQQSRQISEDQSQLSVGQAEEILSQSQGHSMTDSILDDGLSVCTDQLDKIQNIDNQFGFETKKPEKKIQEKTKEEKKNEGQYIYYNVFENYHPLQKGKENPFPWMLQGNEKKKTQRSKKIKDTI